MPTLTPLQQKGAELVRDVSLILKHLHIEIEERQLTTDHPDMQQFTAKYWSALNTRVSQTLLRVFNDGYNEGMSDWIGKVETKEISKTEKKK